MQTCGVISYKQVSESNDGTEEDSRVLLTVDECRRPTAEYQPVVVMATLHQQNDVGEENDVDSAEFGATESPLEPAVMQQAMSSHVQILHNNHRHNLHYITTTLP